MPVGDKIFQRLRCATDAELRAFATQLEEPSSLTSDRELTIINLSKVYRTAAGNSVANVFRADHALPYGAILRDAASSASQAAGWRSVSVVEAAEELWIEEYILQAVTFAARADKSILSDAEKAQARDRAEAMLLGKIEPPLSIMSAAVGLGVVGTGVIAATLALGALPVFAVGGLASLVLNLLGPASRRLLSATLVLIQVRKRTEFEELLQPYARSA